METKTRDFLHHFNFLLSYMQYIFAIPFLKHIPYPKAAKSKKYLDDLCNDVLERRKNMYTDTNTKKEKWMLIDILLEAKDEKDNNFTDSDLKDNIITFFIASNDTTGHSICFALYAISQHPKVEARLYEEISKVKTPCPSPAELNSLQYLNCVVMESLRLYPVAANGSIRMLQKDDVIKGKTFKKGTNIWMGIYTVHTDPRFHPDPLVFNPDRWTEENKAKMTPHTFRGFASGMHVCIGQSFALLEMKTILFRLIRDLHFEAVPNHPVITIQDMTLKSKYGILMNVHPRRLI